MLGIYLVVFPLYFGGFDRPAEIETIAMKRPITPRLIMAGTCDDMGHLPWD
jgi:hypothetical protein